MTAAVDGMWRRVLRQKGLPTDGTAVAEADRMWKEILKEKDVPLDTNYEPLTLPIKIMSQRESEEWVGRQRGKLGDRGYEKMMENKSKTYLKYMVAVDVMDKMMLKKLKKAPKEEEVKKIAEDQEGFVHKRKNKKKKNKRKRHGDDDDYNKKMMKKATTTF